MSDSNVKFMKRSMDKASLNVLSFFQPEDALKLYLNVNKPQPIYVYIDICLYMFVFINKECNPFHATGLFCFQGLKRETIVCHH